MLGIVIGVAAVIAVVALGSGARQAVKERLAKLGTTTLRKALGATDRNILVQFLMEAVTLCLAGGAIGIAIGAGASVVMRQIGGWSTQIEPSAIVIAFAFAAFIGIVFGVWPARRAARLDPIEAPRYE